MRNKCYGVIIALTKYSKTTEIISEVYFANNEKNAILLAMQSENIAEFLADGYAISSKSATAFHETIAPINSESDCVVIRDFDGSLRQLHIDLRTEYPNDFKRDLQAFMSKHFISIDPIYLLPLE